MPGTKHLAESSEIINFMRLHYAEGGTVAAICAAPGLVVSQLPSLAGKHFTCFDGFEDAPIARGESMNRNQPLRTEISSQDAVRAVQCLSLSRFSSISRGRSGRERQAGPDVIESDFQVWQEGLDPALYNLKSVFRICEAPISGYFRYLIISRSILLGMLVIISYGIVPKISASSETVGSSPKW